MIIDTHCHITENYLKYNNIDDILQRAKKNGLLGLIAIGTNLNDSISVIDLSKKYYNIKASIGIHPHEVNQWNVKLKNTLEMLIKTNDILFIGETGLDWHYNLSSKYIQELAFREQIDLAINNKKPIIVHTRQAAQKTIQILKEEKAEKVGGIIHCFSENIEFAKKALDIGFYLSFSGILTFNNADNIHQVAKWAPVDRILIETDAPYLAPNPCRGLPNEPSFIIHTLKYLSKLRQTPQDELVNIMAQNLKTLCGWP